MAKLFKKNKEKSIAMQHITELFNQAETIARNKPELAKRYVELAKNIATRTRTKLPRELKRRFCKHCGTYLIIGKKCPNKA